MLDKSQNSSFLEKVDHWAQALLSPFRHTLQHSVTWSGIGVHRGQIATVSVHPYFPPSQAHQGVIFCGYPLAEWSVLHSAYASCLTHPKVGQKKMTEHLFAALYAAGIDDVSIEVDGEELPILDGSAWLYLEPLKSVYSSSPSDQLSDLSLSREWIHLPKGYAVSWLESDLHVLSDLDDVDQFSVSSALPLQVSLHLNLPPLASHSFDLRTTSDLYQRVIPAKTFGFAKDEQALKSLGLIKGVSYENTRVYDHLGKAINPPHIHDEAAAHKILDFLGDLYRLPYSPKGTVHIGRGSHELNHRFVQAIIRSFKSGLTESPMI